MFYVENNWKVTECDTLKEAVECADGDACYTQQPIKIYGGKYWQTWSDVANDEPILWRSWCPVAYDPDDEDAFNEDSIFDFGDYGYYQPWATKNGWYEGKTQEAYMLDELGEKYQSYEAKKVGGWADVEVGYNPDGIDMSKKYEVEYSAYVKIEGDLFPEKELESIVVYRVKPEDMAWRYFDTYEKARDYLDDYSCGDINKVKVTCRFPQYADEIPGECGCSLDYLLTGDWTDAVVEEIPWEACE